MKISAAEETFEKWRKIFGAVAAPIIFSITYSLTSTLPPEGRRLSAILASMAILWMTETIPLPATALLAGGLCIILGVAPVKQVWAYYADPIIFLFIGSFILARAMTLHKLDRRIALAFLSIPWVGRSPARIMGGMGLITCLMSMWVSNSATTSMMLPVAIGVLGALHSVRSGPGESGELADTPRWRYGTGMMLMIAYASAVGGIGTPVGSPPNLICVGLLDRTAGIKIGFLEWMVYTIPLMLVMICALQFLLYKLHPDTEWQSGRAASGESIGKYVQSEKENLGPWTQGQINTLIAFAVAIGLWLLPGILKLPVLGIPKVADWLDARIPESVAAIVAALLLFLLPVDLKKGEFTISWPEAVKIDWGTILLFGGGLALGTLMFDKGVAKAMGDSLTAHLGVSSMWGITALAIGIGIILSEATSNTAASNMVIPVVITICQTKGISPLVPSLAACLGASYGFMLPVSTPPNAIVYGSGLVSIPAMMRAGILFDILGFFMILVGLWIMVTIGILPR